MDLKGILERGYFPRELPHHFSSLSFGTVVSEAGYSLPSEFSANRNTSIAAVYNLARSGSLRRKLSIPNPVHFYCLSNFIVQEQRDLLQYSRRSPISHTKPGDQTGPRAINPEHQLPQRPLERAKLRASSRYILQADIASFYHSIYSHSIPWAIHSKQTAKRNRSTELIGNELDKLVRNAQDGQTIGIPIGPDTSLLIAEIILGAVDEKLMSSRGIKAFRYIDDYEFAFKYFSEAEEMLGLIQEELNRFELSLNSQKTSIIKLPIRIEPLWLSKLRSFSFRSSKRGQQADLMHYFDTAFEMAAEEPEENILKYAIKKLNGTDILGDNWLLYQNLLSQCCILEPDVLRFVIGQLAKYESTFDIEKPLFEECLNDLIKMHAPLGHGSEVAWAISAAILLEIQIHSEAAIALSSMEDSIVALTALDAESKGLTPTSHSFDHYATHMTTEDLYGNQWLLAYEANIKGWLPSVGSEDNVDADPCFKYLKNRGVSFYNDSLSIDCAVPPSPSSVDTGDGDWIGGFFY